MDQEVSKPPQKLSNYTPQSDSTKFIRTYAKDMAALSPTPQVPVPATPTPQQETGREATTLGVALPEYDPSPVDYGNNRSSRQFDQETVDLKSSDSDGIFTGTSAQAPAAPIPVQTSVPMELPETSIVPTVAPEPESTVPEAPSAQANREEILARLRSKIATPPVEETPTVFEPITPIEVQPEPRIQPVQPAPIPTPTLENNDAKLRTAAPDFTNFDMSWLETTPQPAPTPAQAPVTPPTPKEVVGATPSPIHTYSSDFADRIDSKQSSTFAVLAAQSDAGQTPRTPRPKRNWTPLVAGLVMLVVGTGAIIGAYLYKQEQNASPVSTAIPSVIRYDEAVEVKGSDEQLMQAVSDVGQGGGVTGNIVLTYVTGSSETTGSNIPQPGGELIKRLGLPMPSILLRNIQLNSSVGIVKAESESRPFMILGVNSYERTFAGMLAWEQNMDDDLAIWFPPYASLPTQDASSTSTPVVLLQSSPGFVDAVVANYDVRILRDASGRSIMLYGYRGKDTLIIARDEAAFSALVSRLSSTGE
jgi:hypothetical protein